VIHKRGLRKKRGHWQRERGFVQKKTGNDRVVFVPKRKERVSSSGGGRRGKKKRGGGKKRFAGRRGVEPLRDVGGGGGGGSGRGERW